MRSPTVHLLAAAVILAAPGLLHAQTHVWTGATNGSWNTAANWDAGVPASSNTTILVFNTATGPATNHDIPGGLTLNRLSIGPDAGARTFTGNPLTFDGVAPALIDQATAGLVSLGNPLVLVPTLTVTGGPVTAQFFIDGAVSGGGGMTFTSGFSLLTAANSFTGATVVENSARLGLSRSGALGTSSSLTVGPDALAQIIRSNSSVGTTINRPLALAGTLNTTSKAIPDIFGNPSSSAFYSGAITLSGNGTIHAFGGSGIGMDRVELTLSGAVNRAGNPLTVSTGGTGNTVRLLSTATVGGNGDTLVQPNGGSIIFGGAMSGNGNVSIFSSAAGTVNLTSLAGDGSLNVDASIFGSVAVSGIVSGARDLNITSGTLSLANTASTFTGALNIAGGTLQVAAENRLGNAANTISLSGGGALGLTSSGSLTRAITTSGLGGSVDTNGFSRSINSTVTGNGEFGLFNFGSQSIITLSGTNTFSGGLYIGPNIIVVFSNDANLGAASGRLRFEGGGLSLPAGYGTLSRPLLLTSNGSIGGPAGNTYTISGDITGSGRLDLGGPATFTLTGTNSHAGGVTLAGESTNIPTVLVIDSDARLGTATGVLNLGRPSGIFVLPGKLRAGADLAIAATRTTTFRNMTVDTNGHQVAFNQPISGRGMTKTGAGVWTLNTANTDDSGDNDVTLEEGSLRIGVNHALGTRARIVFFADGSVLDLNGRDLELRSLSNMAPTAEIKLGGGTLTLTTVATGMEGAITGNGNVVLGKIGISSQGFALSGNSTFTGGLTLRGGASLLLQHSNSLGAPGNTLTVDNGTISIGTLAATPLTIDASSNLTIAAGGARFVAGGQSIIIASQLSGSNPIRFGGGSFPGENPTYDVRLTHVANTFVGDIQLGESQFFGSAMLGLVADGSLGNASNRVTLGSKFFDGESLKSDRGGLRAYANLTLPASRVIRLEGSTDPSDDRGGVFDTNGFNLTVSGGISELSAGMPLVKAGAGTLTLNGIQTYTGITDVEQGTLAGTGTLGPIEVFSAATLAPGSSVGTLRTGNVTFQADSTLALDFSSPSVADQLAVTGTVSLGGNVGLALALNYTPAAGDTFVVIANDGADPINTSGGLFSFGGTPLAEGASFQSGGASWTLSYIGGTGNDVTLSLTPATSSNLAMTSFTIGNPAGGAAGKQVQGTISGSPGASIRLMRSATLADWTLLTTIVLDGSGQGGFDIIDPLASDRAFYRLFFP